ncbi:hypothetical protein BDF14DRAFT_246659 [Spinellus fusiger]|nr:hypothetical protein BDF14DRAFT_246659 [Spinellus fusiger]
MNKKAKILQLKRNLAHVSFEQLAEIKNKIGMKEMNKIRDKKRSNDDEETPNKPLTKAQIIEDLKNASRLLKGDRVKRTKMDMKRDSKHSPMEMSSKRAVSRLREVVPMAANKRRDPRFDKLSGQLNQDLFEKSYEFLNDYKQSEQAMLRERIKKERDPDVRSDLETALMRMTSKEYTAKEAKRKQMLARQRKKTEAELVEQGKTPYFLKRSEKRKLDLVDRYNKLGQKDMDKILEKRRKRNANKDHRRVPFSRRSE